MRGGHLKEKVAVAMSGGVDSSTAAAVLKQQGFSLIGITMKLWDDSRGYAAQDVCDAKRVAGLLHIPHYTIDFSKAFSREVLEPSVEQYSRGKTPNPCVVCNQKLKFGLLSERARELGARYLATGHYARVEYDDARSRFVLKKGLERKKEQSYWLAMLSQKTLARTLLPLGAFSKNEIRRLAAQFGLKVARKRESQDVCCLGNFQRFIGRCVESGSGPIVDMTGNVIGMHGGVHLYTVGQRRGLGISASRPLYVVRIDHETNTIVAGEESALYCSAFVGVKPNWIGVKALARENEVEVKIRYRGVSAKASVSTNRDDVMVRFGEPQKAITPGQLAVFYQGDEVVGGAWIERVIE